MKKYIKYIVVIMCIIAFLISMCFIPINASKLIPLLEKQFETELGSKVHIEKLVLRLGPYIKLKAPVMHVMHSDGHKYAQFNGVKFYISWATLFNDSPILSKLSANKFILRVNSDDKQFYELIEKLGSKDFNETPNIYFKNYTLQYLNKKNDDKYILEGQNLDLSKVRSAQNYKIKTLGNFNINNKKYINYDISFYPKYKFSNKKISLDLVEYVNQIKELDFNADLIADVKLYKNQADIVQASGYINVDNISVLDNQRKNPKSFIYLTLWGDKASVLSNIYTSAAKKIYIEGMVNNSQKPVLDLKVKTDNIELSDLYSKIKVFADLSKLKNIDSINGILTANFTLKGDLNRIKSNGYLKVENASIKANGLQIHKINSEIDFSNNAINIVNSTGYVNNSPIMLKGYIDKKLNLELLMSKVELKYLCPTYWGIKDGITSLAVNISGTLDNIIHKENIQIENLKLVNNWIDLSLESLKIDTNKNNTANINNIQCKTNETELIKIPTLKLLIDDDRIKIPDTNIFMQNSMLTAKSEITNYNNNDISFNLLLNGFVNSKDIIRFNNYSARYPIKLNLNGNRLTQVVNAQLLFENTLFFDEPSLVNLIGKFEKNSLKIDDLSLLSFKGKFSDDYKANLKGQKKLTISGLVDDFKKPVFKNIRLFIPQQLNIKFLDTLAQVKGDIFLNGNIQLPEIVGQIQIGNLYNQHIQLILNNTSLDFNKNTVNINSPTLKLGDSAMGLNALISTDISKGIIVKSLNIKSKYLNTDTLLMYKDAPFLNSLPIIIQNGKFYSERVLANIYSQPVYLSAFTSDIFLKDNVLELKNIASELFNGKLSGNIIFNLRDEHYNTSIMARSVSASPIFNIISNRNDNISGNMDFDANLVGELISKQSINGNVKFVVQNGRMSTLGKLEHLLYAQNVVADNMLRTSLSVVTKAITLKDTGLFKYLRGDVQIDKGLVNIKFLQSQGPLMALFIKGQYNPITDYASLVVLGRLSDEIISGLGAFGDFSFNKLMIMLTGEETKNNINIEDLDKLPQLPMKNTKEFRSIINGIIDKPSSVILFNWISYSQKSLKQKDVQINPSQVPSFVEDLPY